MQPRGRGRAGPRQAQQQQGGAPQGPRPGPPRGGQAQGAWGARPSGPPQGPPAPGAPPQGAPAQRLPSAWSGRGSQPPRQGPPAPQPQWAARPPVPEALAVRELSAGRGARVHGAGGEATSSLQVSGPPPTQGGDTSTERRGGGNGGVRGRINRNEIINTRPGALATKQGTEGQTIALRANYFKLLSSTKWALYQYRVDFMPDSDDTRERKKLVSTGIKDYMVTGYLFDGTVLYTPSRIHPDPLEFVVANDREENIRVTVRLVGEVAWGDWHYLQLFNIIMRKCLTHMDFKLLGRNYFDPASRIEIPNQPLELWPGFMTSMRQYEQDIMLNADLSFKTLRMDTVYDLLVECGRGPTPKKEFQLQILGKIVLTRYNNKTYRIDDVDFDSNPDSTFTKRDGTEISYRRYFEDRYKLRIRNNNQPMLVSRSKPREIRAGMPELVILVPELCVMTGLSDKQRENFHLMRSMATYTRVGARERMEKLKLFSRRLLSCPAAVAEIKRWDLKIAEDLIQFSGRVLPQEPVLLRNSQEIYGGDEADWTRGLRSAPMYNTSRIDKLAVICPRKFRDAASEFINILRKAAKGMSFPIGDHKIWDLQDDRAQSYISTLEQIIPSLQPSLCLVILANNSADKYNSVKKKCYVDRAMPCQVLLSRNLTSKGVMSIATKVAIQMNCKVGGAPWAVPMPRHTMVCGYDVCRDTANKGKSFAGMVASLDAGCTQYFSMAVEHEHEQELSNNIAIYIILACKRYLEVNKVLPERIIIYRDGVGDGQIPYVKDHEVELLKTKLKSDLYKNKELKLAFIVVSKRINTKIFRAQGDRNDNFNPPPGTVVDDVITWPERYDFYIVSQCVRQGTVAPTSYNVIEDTLGIDANRLQKFTYRMCHMYFNWSGTVRVPAPCQYAHKLAFLTAQSLHRPANAALSSSLYYL